MNMAKSENNWAIFGLLFIGSLFYLYVAFTSSGSYANGAWGAAALWQPFFYAAAMISSIALFFLSFGFISKYTKELAYCAKLATVGGGFALVTLTFGSMGYFLASIIGFIIALIGVIMTYR
jgi:hypothetical protein